MDNICFMRMPTGEVLKITDDGHYLTGIQVAEHACGCCLGSLKSEIGMKTCNQLDEYFKGERKTFDLPVKYEGSRFQQSVWEILMKIPFGETRSYKQVAIESGNSKGSRAVGNAVGKNPILIVIPCHRVIKSDGKLGGFSGGIETKIDLLEIEGIKVNI